MLRVGLVGLFQNIQKHKSAIERNGTHEVVGVIIGDQIKQLLEQDYDGVKICEHLDDLIYSSDVLVILDNSINQHDFASRALRSCKHVFVRGPLQSNIHEATDLLSLAEEAGVKLRLGNFEKFNPSFVAAHQMSDNPMYFESQHHESINNYSSELPVVLSIMLNDIDMVISMVKSRVKRVAASGVPVINGSPDIVNANIEFENGCVANLVASRVSMKPIYEIKLFQRDKYMKVNMLINEIEVVGFNKGVELQAFADRTSKIVSEFDYNGNVISSNKMSYENKDLEEIEIEDFFLSIETKGEQSASAHDGFYALDIAQQIMNKLNY